MVSKSAMVLFLTISLALISSLMRVICIAMAVRSIWALVMMMTSIAAMVS